MCLQLENTKSQAAVSIVRTLPGPSCAVLAATTDATLRVLDARDARDCRAHEFKVTCVCAYRIVAVLSSAT